MTTGHPDRTRPPPADPADDADDADDAVAAPPADDARHGLDTLLRAERVRVAYWRRLVRARMDLAAAALALPDPLGQHPSSCLALVARDALPTYLVLLDAVSVGGPQGEIDRLETLRDLDDRLAGYERTISRELRAAVVAGVPPRPRGAAGGTPEPCGGSAADAPDQARWGRLSA